MIGDFSYTKYFISIFIMFAFLFFLWVISKWLIKNRKNLSGKNFRNGFNIINKYPIGMDKFLLLFEFNNKYYLVLIGKNHSELLDVYDDISSYDEDAPKGDGDAKDKKFLEILKSFQGLNKNL